MSSSLRIAIIGCGSMGEIHARCLSAMDGVQIHALCDVDEQRARALCDQFHGTYAGRRKDLLPWLEGAEINRDGNLRLQYMAGLALNTSMETAIYSDILSYRQYPNDMLVASEPVRQSLMQALPGGQR